MKCRLAASSYPVCMTVDVRHLRAFVAIAREGTITGAARTLSRSQPAVSRLLQELEEHLGRALVERSTHHLRLTAQGETYLVLAVGAVQALDATLSPAALDTRPLRIGHSWSALGARTGEIVTSWDRAHPGTPVELRRFDDRLAGLSTGEVDAVIVRDLDPGIPGRRVLLGREERVVALPASHSLAERARITLDDLATVPLVVNTVSGTTPRDLWGHRRHGAVVEVSNTDDWLLRIATGAGVGVTSAATAAIHASPDVAYRPVLDALDVYLELAWGTAIPHPRTEDFAAHCAAALA